MSTFSKLYDYQCFIQFFCFSISYPGLEKQKRKLDLLWGIWNATFDWLTLLLLILYKGSNRKIAHDRVGSMPGRKKWSVQRIPHTHFSKCVCVWGGGGNLHTLPHIPMPVLRKLMSADNFMCPKTVKPFPWIRHLTRNVCQRIALEIYVTWSSTW